MRIRNVTRKWIGSEKMSRQSYLIQYLFSAFDVMKRKSIELYFPMVIRFLKIYIRAFLRLNAPHRNNRYRIECVLLSFFSENFVSTKWRIYKGIFGSSRLLREGISRGREEGTVFFCQTKFTKRYKFEILNGKIIYKMF